MRSTTATARAASRRFIRAVIPAALGLAGASLAPLPARALAVFAPAFAGPSLDPGLAESGTTGTGFSVSAGALVLTQAAGNPNGSVQVTTTAPVSGNFSAQVTVSGPALGLADAGLLVSSDDTGSWLSDAFMNGRSSTVNGNIFQPASGNFLASTATTVTLTISRSGDTVTDSVGTGAGRVTLDSVTSAALGGTVDIGLFLLEAAGDTSADQVTFTGFSVLPIPEPSAAGVLLPGALALAGLAAVTRRCGRPGAGRPRQG